MRLPEPELRSLVHALLSANGLDPISAAAVASVIVGAERDGTFSHGLTRLPGYLSSLRSGWVDSAASMTVADRAPSVVHVDAANGFAQAALARASGLAIAKARATGVCAVSIHNSHHFGSLWADVEPFAEQGLVCMAFVNTRSLIRAPGAHEIVLGTNPMAFGFPRKDAPPLVWDQASSVMAHGDVLIAARNNNPLPPGAAVDREGHPTQDPNRVLDGGALLPFGGHKGFLIALLVEVMAAAMTGSRFGFEDDADRPPGAVTSNAGEMVLLIDPDKTGAGDFTARVERLLAELVSAGTDRLPAARRYQNRETAELLGIEVSEVMLDLLQGKPRP